MQKIYTISPFIRAASLPDKTDVAFYISKYFFFFNIIHRNKTIVEIYMAYINKWFYNAFNKLGYEIIDYEYPDDIEYGSYAMIEYINNRYNLDDDFFLSYDYMVEIDCGPNWFYGQFESMCNHMILEQLAESEIGVFDGLPVSQLILIPVAYLNSEYRDILSPFCKMLMKYDDIIEEICSFYSTIYGNKFIEPNYTIYYQTLQFILAEIKEA